MAKNIKACLSHNTDEWSTPSNLYQDDNDRVLQRCRSISLDDFIAELYW